MDRGLVLERERQLSGVAKLAEAVTRGTGGTIVLEGQPGLGKSALLAEATRRLERGAGPRVLSFCCGELEQDFAWGAVRGLLAWLSAPDDLCAGVQTVFAAVSRLADGSPLLLTLDDAQWCDAPSLHALMYLQRRLHALSIGLVVAMRPPAGTAQRSLLERLEAGPDTEVYRLRPLSLAAVTTLVGCRSLGDADPRFCEACHELTAGNPFYLRELLAECREREIDPRRPSAELSTLTPPKVLSAVLLRLERLTTPGAAALARAAAVLGDGAPMCRTGALAGLDAAGATAALDALSAADLLCGGEPLRFVHPLVRTAIYTAIPAAERAAQHARAADFLLNGHAPVELVGEHLLRAPRDGDAGTVATLRDAAARACAQGTPEAAARYLRRALEEPPPPQDRAAVLHDLARTETMLGDPRSAGRLTEALELVPAGRRRVTILRDLGRVQHHAGRFTASADAFERGLAIARAAPDQTLAGELEAGYLMSAALDTRRADEARRRVDAIQDGPAELLAQLLRRRTMAAAPRGELIDRAQRLWAGGALLHEAGAGSPALWPVIEALSCCDAYRPALRAVEIVLEAASEQGLALTTAQARLARAAAHHRLGRLAEVPADARAAIEVGWDGLDAHRPAAAYLLGLAELELGNTEAAAAALDLAGPADRWEGTGPAAFIHALNGELALNAGQAGAALAAFEACGRLMDALRIVSPAVMTWRSDAARALIVLGEIGPARGLAEAELRVARACGAPRAVGVALRVCGLARGGDAGIELLREAVDLQARCGAELERARAEIDLGAAVRRGGGRRSARPYLQAGLGRAQAAGATGLARRAETELRAAGSRGRRPTETGPGQLTASERRIAELAAQGYSNRSIAGLLQISVKGVEWHLHQSYRKLDITGRRQLGPALLREASANVSAPAQRFLVGAVPNT